MASVNDLTSLLFKEMKLVISALKNKYTDQNFNMGLSSYKKKLDVLKHYNNKCPSCGQTLSTAEFSLDVEKK